MKRFLAPLTALSLIPLLQAAAPGGGTFPWRTLQAEAATTNAEVLPPSRSTGDFAAECVGRQGVKLTQHGDFVEFTAPENANSIVLRYAIPDAKQGGGIQSTLSVYIDGEHRADLPLTSRHTWLYGKENAPTNDPEELTRVPGGTARRFFDDARLLTGTIPAGAKIRLQKDPSDDAAFYVIDLIDLELVPPPLPPPQDALDVRSFGAMGDGETDDTGSLQRCFDAAAKSGKPVYLSPGEYRTSRGFRIESLTIQGAGPWYSVIRNRRSDLTRKSPGFGFGVYGKSTLRDFALFGDGTRRNDEAHPLSGTWGKGSLVENLWVEQAECGLWAGRDLQTPTEQLTVRNCRFRNLLADGINLCAGTSFSIVENCHARGTGDDSFAIWSAPKGVGPNRGNLIRNCTAEAPWRARCFAIFGGEDNRIENCIGRDTLTDSGINLSTEFNAWPFGGTTTVDRVLLERCGGWFWGNRPYGALFFHAADRDYEGEIVLTNLTVRDSSAAGISISNGGKRLRNITIRNSRFENCGDYAIDIFPDAHGELTLEAVTFTGAGEPPRMRNRSPKTFELQNRN